jgi:hypothetical protein
MATQKSRPGIRRRREIPSHQEIVHDKTTANTPAILRVGDEAVFLVKSDRGTVATIHPQFHGGGPGGGETSAEESEGL